MELPMILHDPMRYLIISRAHQWHTFDTWKGREGKAFVLKRNDSLESAPEKEHLITTDRNIILWVIFAICIEKIELDKTGDAIICLFLVTEPDARI